MNTDKRESSRFYGIIVGAVSFGLGFVIAEVIHRILFQVSFGLDLLQQLSRGSLIDFLLVVIGILMVFGGIVGGLGGFGLSFINHHINRRRLIFSGIFSFAISYGIIIFLMVLVLSLIGFYNGPSNLEGKIIPLVTIFSAVFGVVMGLILGLLTIRRGFWRVVIAGGIGFGLGGLLLGNSLKGYLFQDSISTLDIGASPWLFLWLFVFGALGGGFLGLVYQGLKRRIPDTVEPKQSRPLFRVLKIIVIVLSAALVVLVISRVDEIARIKPAYLSDKISTDTIGTHWLTPVKLPGTGEDISSASISINSSGQHSAVWSQVTEEEPDVYYSLKKGDWIEPVNVSQSPNAASREPQIALDDDGIAHIVWSEFSGTAGNSDIYYSQCHSSSCTSPFRISGKSELNCISDNNEFNSDQPTIAVGNDSNTIMAVWHTDNGQLAYSTWLTSESMPESPVGCIPLGGIDENPHITSAPKLTGLDNDKFGLGFSGNVDGTSNIFLTRFRHGEWENQPKLMGGGSYPDIQTDLDGNLHAAWCGQENKVHFWLDGGEVTVIDYPACQNKPGLGVDSFNRPHLVWYSNQMKNIFGQESDHMLLFESIRDENEWTQPAIIAATSEKSYPDLDSGLDGKLHLIWNDITSGEEVLKFTSQVQYECAETSLSDTGKTVLDVVSQLKFRPPNEIVPYCGNRYDGLVNSPNPPIPLVFEGAETWQNGPYDQIKELVESAQYEVLFSTMMYKPDNNQDSPGFVLAEGVAELYRKVKQDPSKYPRGMTVRILLGNPPEPFTFDLGNQLYNVLKDLRNAGVPEMENPDIGWNLEVANFAGSWPHSHTKMVIIDGKTAVAVGFNFEYIHFPKDHPSGKGNDRVDPGIRITGPAAQSAQAAFDDQWRGAYKRHCTNFHPAIESFWGFTCQREQVTSIDHVPEVKKYYLPNAESDVFSLYRTEKFRESDQALQAAIESAKNSVDVFEINFTLESICNLTPLLGDFCNFENTLSYMPALVEAAEENGAKIRLLIFYDSFQSLENEIGFQVFERELESRGLSDLLEIRYYNDGDMHSKAIMIDDEFVVIGSQNFSYSAWDDGALLEYNFGVEDPQAVDDFKKMFEYHWDNAIPR